MTELPGSPLRWNRGRTEPPPAVRRRRNGGKNRIVRAYRNHFTARRLRRTTQERFISCISRCDARIESRAKVETIAQPAAIAARSVSIISIV